VKLLFHKDELQKRRDFYNDFRLQKKKNLVQWLYLSFSLFLLVGCLLVFSYTHASRRLASIESSRMRLEHEIALFQKELRERGAKNKSNKVIAENGLKITRIEGRKRSVSAFLEILPSAIPGRTWLEKIVLEDESVLVEGGSCDDREIVVFYKKLSETGFLSDCRMNHRFVDKNFSFRIVGHLSV